ncbi:DUF3320 domain-containing protein [Cytophagaceae bacterium DM2B3-1]|uniref:DUF3320 domain-containing protein n=1 Tax=Xanthocytophaga flava TaxID=3048013 RepID=A0ABT7CJH8_9BACT|nr:DUF3320 domain-containing protein [Xanthocytophaga flavus]MDJ1493671.1 DUF3320 domain-containing protein [Xanthocytophaga flavus]
MSTITQAIVKELEDNRRELLDLSSRNRLISIPLTSKIARVVQIFDEKSEEVFKKLVGEKKSFTFLPGKVVKDSKVVGEEDKTNNELLVELPLPEDDPVDATTGLAKRHVDTKLQTRLSPEVLQRKLFDFFNESQTLIQEQGVNILYLAIGFVKWVDKSYGSTERFAPLLLIPVDLVRKSATERFAIKWREEDLQENLSLSEKFRIEFGVKLPALTVDDPENFDLKNYFLQVQQDIDSLPGWSVDVDGMCLGFFSFAKFLMYRDLDDTTWPEGKSITQHPLIRQLLLTNYEESGSSSLPSLQINPDRLDESISVDRLDHIVDADSSQTVAIEMVRSGRNLVIQGPPGTGKSQTITNLIATAVLDGKKVLFIAEKLAALEVVKRRLEKEHLGALCLELHSNKARKATVVSDLKQTWDLGKPKFADFEQLTTDLERHRNVLNKYPELLHTFFHPAKKSAFDFLGMLAKNGRPEKEELHIRFSGAESWTQNQVKLFQEQLKELQIRLEEVKERASHPWRGVRQTVYLGTERELIKQHLQDWLENTDVLQQVSLQIQAVLHLSSGEVAISDLERINRLAQWSSLHPDEQLDSIPSSLWDNAVDTLLTVVNNKDVYEKIVAETEYQVLPSIWKSNISFIRQQLALHGSKWYKFLIGSYRKAMAQFQSELKISLPKTHSERLELAERVLKGQQALEYVQAKEKIAREAFGVLWDLEGTSTRLMAISKWIKEGITAGFTSQERQAAYKADRALMTELHRKLKELLSRHYEFISFFEEKLKMDWTAYVPNLGASQKLTLAQWHTLQDSLLHNLDSIAGWIALEKQLAACKESALLPLVQLIEKGAIQNKNILVSFNRIWAQQCIEQLFSRENVLATFDGNLHEKKIEAFQKLDKERLNLSKLKVLDAHYTAIPEKRPIGMVGTVLGEVNKQRNHKPIRKLLKEAGPIVQNLKPVFMMSPLSVAQYLEPGAIEFDLLIIDEASQIQPVDALGAVARAKQIVVVGDDKQLPPTTFFSKVTSNSESEKEEEDEAGQVKAKELESILSLCKARGIGDTLLRWHYRSRHESLIAISNKRYYENKLFIVPSPWKQNAGLGLKWHQVDGIYDRANTRSNKNEAREVALAVLTHAKNHSYKTLGVAAFSMSQQRAILDEIELLRRAHPEIEPFFLQHVHEPFFVKNLENVQGDERDVIFLSVGYGKDAEGKMLQNFGPLNKEGGERRLNVLISRARQCCEVFSSITEQDIVVNETTREGVKGLKHFLQYARTGIFDTAQISDRPMGSPLEEAVKDAIEKRFGWEVQTQVGVAGFFIDLAIVDPQNKGRFVIGIECDGVAYHSSPSARERDRLRQSVLESQGWFIHRLWGIDFFKRPDQELQKIELAYNQALEWLSDADALSVVAPEEEKNVFHVLREQEEQTDWTVPYQFAKNIQVPSSDPYELYASQISEILYQILQVEAPMHFDELVTRSREQWGWSRAADRFRNHMTEGLTVLTQSGKAMRDGDFISLPGQEQTFKVRKRSENEPSGTRKPQYISFAEIDLALKLIVKEAYQISSEEAAKQVSRAFGFKSLSSEFKNIIDKRINALLINADLVEIDGKLTISN